jgi:hypothetical protein
VKKLGGRQKISTSYGFSMKSYGTNPTVFFCMVCLIPFFITKLVQVNRRLSKITTLSVFIRFWCFIPFWNQETKQITFRINLRQSGQVRLSPEGCLAVLFVLRNAKPFWIHKVMIQRVKDYQSLKYQITIFSQLIFFLMLSSKVLTNQSNALEY